MTEVIDHKEWLVMRNNIRRVVQSLEVCWKCQRVCECSKYILGQTVLVWLCEGCLCEMERPIPDRQNTRIRAAVPPVPVSGQATMNRFQAGFDQGRR